MSRTIILASGSPRRRELLMQMGIADFQVIPAKGEEITPEGLDPSEKVRQLAKQKAEEVFASYPEAVVIGADTIVVLDREVLGKPHSEEEAFQMLSKLSGREHEVFTGVAVCHDCRTELHAERTLVHFRPLTEKEIREYIASGEPMDKAGAYGIQGRACIFIRGIEGDYYNVVGLPVCALQNMLSDIGI